MLEDVMVISRYPSGSFDTILSNLFWNVHLLHPGGGGGEEGPAVVPGDELVQAGGEDSSLSSC